MFINLSLPVQIMGLRFSTYLACCFAVIFIVLELLQYWDAEHDYRCLRAIPTFLKFFAYVGGLLVISLLGLSRKQFIYFYY